ncbi:MAG: DNA methyltransferase [Tenericutes bacterium]|nr:DNA methyltransferase [Mycoplasmatota bacterium]
MARRANDLTGKEWLQNSFSIWRDLRKDAEEKKLEHPASYPVALCEKLIKTFTRKDFRVLDPFNGVGSTLVAAKNLGGSGVGIDLSEDYCNISKKRLDFDSRFEVVNGDSFKVLKDESLGEFDICVTSPPYWDILNMKRSADMRKTVNYSDSSVDLGNISDYDLFLDNLKELFSNVYLRLKPDTYCLINVMDLRKKSEFYPLHSDLAYKLREVGFVFDDLIIWDRQLDYNNMRPLGYPYRFRINKVHEYILIMHKK